ncbi:MAG: N-acetylmuramoyl-L-alanine amidase [Bacteroidetes bacterium]|nr:N-acetylmuramoyl-L-alanine amidase [Bacteroidota bacterium]
MILLRFIFLLFLLNPFLSLQSSPAPDHVTATAQKGDGVYSFLEKYLVKSPCNISYFRKINNLKKGDGLHANQTYRLPILVYTYNGRSIRSTTGINDLPWAENIQKFNELLKEGGIKPEDYRKDKALWVPYNQIHCRSENVSYQEVTEVKEIETETESETEPEKETVQKEYTGGPLRGNYAIFGEKYGKVPLLSTKLSGKVYYVVGGHGGPDPGAIGTFGNHKLCEDEYAYDVALRLTRNLLAHGATVYMITRDENDGIRDDQILTCDKDETIWVNKKIPAGQAERLNQRSDAINKLYKKNKKQGVFYQRLVVIHVDSDRKNEKVDLYFYHKEDDEESKELALTLQQKMKQKYDEIRKNRGYEGSVTPRDLHMLRETEPTAVFIELGNIKNSNDQQRLIQERNRQLIADWLFEGLVEDAQ